MAYRPLTAGEIRQLEAQGCEAEDWAAVMVRDPFPVDRVREAGFSGAVRLGTLAGSVTLPGGIGQPCGVFRARIHACTIGDRCRVAGVGLLANYRIGDDVLIENVGTLQVTGETAFGNGIEIEALNESGGRSLPICDRLSSQLAYLIVCYRHRPELLGRLRALVLAYADTCRTSTGTIGEGTVILNTRTIRNLRTGPATRIDGAELLEEGSIGSCREAPAVVGTAVIARRFVMLSGSVLEQGAIIDRCFLGQHVRMGRQFSAENSAFFSNSELFCGEACSVFGGPYTVSHHKSTLLIAGLFSFYNAGSGTNQSNHMYKLGPVHQGVLERGCKTGSGSYLLWPGRVGAFSNVIGKHYAHFDTSDLPFSVINEHQGRSACIPGMNLFTVGTRRDGVKWPQRDGRKDPDLLDQLHFTVLSPYVVGRMLRGVARLDELARSAREGQEFLNFNGIAIQKLVVKTAARFYEIGIRLFLGGCLLKQLEGLAGAASLAEVRAALATDIAGELHRWLDIGGLLAPEPAVADLLARVTNGELADLDGFLRQCRALHADYERHEWAWCARLIEERTGQQLAAASPALLASLIEEWRTTITKFNNLVLQDAAKEFDADMQLSYGIDGDAAVRAADFAAVRGSMEENSFARSVREDSERAAVRAARATAFLDGLA